MNYRYTGLRIIVVFILTVVSLQSMHAAVPALIRRKVLFNDADRTDAQISPDGSKLASLAKRNGVVNLWIRTVGTYADSVITNETKYDIQSYKWAQDGKHLVYLRTADDGGKHIFSTDGVSTKDLTPFDKINPGIAGIFYEINAGILGTNSKYPFEILATVGAVKQGVFDVYRINIESGKSKRVGGNTGEIVRWYADNDFKLRAALAVSGDGTSRLLYRKTEDSKWITVASWTIADGEPTIWGFNANNSGVFASDSRGSKTNRAVEISLGDGTVREIASDSIYDTGEILTSPVDHHLQAVFTYAERLTWKLIDTSLTRDSLFLGYMDGDNTIVSRDNNDSLWVVRSDRDIWPVRYVLYNHKKRVSNVQFSERPSLEKYLLTARNPISFTASDGVTLHGYLTLPNGLDPDTAAMVVLVHGGPMGGPWSRDDWGFDATTQWLANRGYAILQLNFRGSAGYGKDFLNAADKRWSGVVQRDIVEGVRWVLSQGFIDSTRIAIWGEGFGGYSALMGLAQNTGLFCAGIDISGSLNLSTSYPSDLFSRFGLSAILRQRVGDIEKDASALKAASPITIVDKISRPLLIAQGSGDQFTLQKDADAFVAALKTKNPNVQYLVFPDEGIGFSKTENRLKFYEAAEEFLGKYLKGRVE